MARSRSPQADLAVIAAYQRQTEELRTRVEKQIARMWAGLGSWRNADIVKFTRQAVPYITAAQSRMSSLTTGYLSAQRNAVLGRTLNVRVDPKRVSGAAARNGAHPRDVYERPFHLVWRQLHDLPRVEGSIDQAIEAGQSRAVYSALTDLQLTKVQTTLAVAKHDRHIVFSQRVIEGERTCGLCIVASTQRYGPDELMPIHGGCDCSQRFIYSDEEPPPVHDLERLSDVHDRIHQRFGASSSAARQIPGVTDARGLALHYRDVLITHDHGELGPVLGIRGSNFVGPDDL